MKNTMKKVLCTLLVVVMCLTSVPIINFSFVAKATDYNVGDIVQIGSYPQSLVSDSKVISELNEQTLNWISYKYMKPETRNVEEDFMKYADIDLNDDGKYDYRAVTFSKYRSRYAINYDSTPVSYQDDNGYEINKIYYFKYEPLLWSILDVNSGLIFCEELIDAQHYNKFLYWTGSRYKNKTGYVNNWEISYIREWLNIDFYNIAFSNSEKNIIHTTTIQNKGYNNSFNYADTKDKLFLLSYSDMLNVNYGFTSSNSADAARTVKRNGTDYAKCQGLMGGTYYLRSAGFSSQSDSIVSVRQDGSIDHGAHSHSWDNYGIRPAMCVDLTGVGFVGEGEGESWKQDKVKIEFRFADTKKLIDTSDEHTLDRQVALNFTTTDDFHSLKRATNGILYLEDFYFPMKSFKATWSSAFGDGTEYIYQSDKIINANAGDTIIVYMSTNVKQSSVTTKVVAEKTNYYGAYNAASTIETEIRVAAKELNEYIGEYISLINGTSVEKNKKKKNNNNVNASDEVIQKSAKAIMNAGPLEKIYAVSVGKEAEYALCYALATVFNEKTLDAIDLGKINLNKSKEEIDLNLTRKLIENFGEINKTVTYDKYKIELKINTWGGDAFEGTYSIHYNNTGKRIAFGPLVSSVKATESTLYSYFTSMTDLVNDMLKASMASIFTELSDVTGLTSFREEALNSSVKNALSYLEKKGFGKVINILKTAKKIYTNINKIASATSDLTVSNLLDTEKKTRELYEIVFNNSFSSSKVTDATAKEIISKIETSRKELYNLLYNKLYGINSDDAGDITKLVNWVASKFYCPVDIEVYNEAGELIGYVDTLGRHDEFIYYSDGIYIEVRGDKKFVYHPADKAVTFKIYGTDDGSMTYSVETVVDGESVDRLNYYDVVLSEGCEYSQTIEADLSLSENKDTLMLVGDSETYSGEYLSVDDDTAHIRVLYSTTDGGSVSGDMYYPKGDCVTLYAYPEEGYIFAGWYENDKCVSEEEIYRFAAVRDVFLEAKFEEIEETVVEEDKPATLDRIILSEKELSLKTGETENLYYIMIPTISGVSLEWYSSDATVATVDENGIISALSEGAAVISVKDTITNKSAQCRVVVDGDSSCSYLGHEFKDWYYVVFADCEKDGSEQRRCAYCDYYETNTIPATKHSYSLTVVEPTCIKNGYTIYSCDCGDTYTTDEVLANGHTESDWIIDKEATCSAEGSKHIECTVCGEVLKTESISKVPHNYTSVSLNPTCTANGIVTYTCACNDSYTETIEATGHSYADNGICKNCDNYDKDYDKSNKTDNCSCNCHKGGFMGFIWKLINFFNKLFKTNKTCSCGVSHY